MNNKLLFFIYTIIFFSCSSCQTGSSKEEDWITSFPLLGTYSSPKLIDLTQDGIKDVVIGSGRNEYEKSLTGVIALDGKTGALLWTYPCKDQIVGSAIFLDVNQDNIPDVIIGGRSAQLFALDGSNGNLIWEHQIEDDLSLVHSYARFNFYNPQIIPDQNNDGLDDLLVPNGGNVRAPAYTEENRYPGVLMIMDSKNGAVIAADTMPDGKETYMSPVVYDFEGDNQLEIIFGTGGETVSGSLYMAQLNDIKAGTLKNAKNLMTEEGHGFFAPPVITDITNDGVKDIIANAHSGKTYAIDGKQHQLLWQTGFDQTEASNSLAPGFFNEDNIPDFFAQYSKGKWPKNEGLIQVWIDGKTGEHIKEDSIGCFGFFTPLAYDLNEDKIDEVIFGINRLDCSTTVFNNISHDLIAWDISTDTQFSLDKNYQGKNIASTPWIGDIDNNGKLNIVYCIQENRQKLFNFLGIKLIQIETEYPFQENLGWKEYMGSESKCIF